MLIGVTGATGFLGRYLVRHLVEQGHRCRCLARESSDRSGFEAVAESLEWVQGSLGDQPPLREFVAACDAVVHAALDRPGTGFRGAEGDVVDFVRRNVLGTLELMEAARKQGVGRFVFISTCAVHEKILDDRPLDETHPVWPASHYGAHKAAVEAFVHSYGWGEHYPICALRPTGIYGVSRPVETSKWYALVRDVVQGKAVECRRGGKEVHAADVAKATGLLVACEPTRITGQVYNCYDQYVSQYEVAALAKELSGSSADLRGEVTRPKHEIQTARLQELGMRFGGDQLLKDTVKQLVDAARQASV